MLLRMLASNHIISSLYEIDIVESQQLMLSLTKLMHIGCQYSSEPLHLEFDIVSNDGVSLIEKGNRNYQKVSKKTDVDPLSSLVENDRD